MTQVSYPRFFGITRFGHGQTQPCPAALATPLVPTLTN